MGYTLDVIVPRAGTSPFSGTCRVLLAAREFERLRDAEAFVSRQRESWRGALEGHETHIQAWFRDSDGQVVRLRELDGTFGDPGVAHSRAALQQLRPGGLR